MPKLKPKEMKLEMEETIPVIIFPPIFDYPYCDGVGDEMECGYSEPSIYLPGCEIYFPNGVSV